MQLVTRVDGLDRKTVVQVPDGAPETQWKWGIEIGPPDLSPLGLPEEVQTRLHNELYNRGIVRREDARARRADIHAALMAALRVDSERIIQLYEE